MRWLSLLASTLLAGSSLVAGAKKSTASKDRFVDFHAKQLAASPLKLDDNSFTALTKAPRNHSSVVLLTAMDARYGCQLCREFQPEFDLLARSWTKGDKKGESRVVFGVLDFGEGRQTFMSLGLQTAPVLFLYPPTIGPFAASSPDPIRYDFASGGGPAEVAHQWLVRQLPGRLHPDIRRPINWFAWLTGTTLLLGGVTAVFVAWPYVMPVVQNRNVWAAISLIAILLFTSGHMFNHIRKVPYVAGNGQGGVSYFAGGFQNQFGMETQIIAGMYAVLSFSVISLALKVPRIIDSRTQKIAAAAWAGVLFVMYSFLLSVFRIKNNSYPFSLPPFM